MESNSYEKDNKSNQNIKWATVDGKILNKIDFVVEDTGKNSELHDMYESHP